MIIEAKKGQRILSRSVQQTKKVAAVLVNKILFQGFKPQGALVIGLSGALGAGKTTLTQFLAQGLGVKERVLSPTFVIMRRYRLSPRRNFFSNFYHFDCYRLGSPQDILTLGWEEIIADRKNIVVVEWPEKIQALWQEDFLNVRLTAISPHQREIYIMWGQKEVFA